jgi:branched-chain amino acid transport system ATP-binding protein
MLEIRKLTVHRGPLPALQEVSMEVRSREIVALIGPNRAGKTTLLLTLSGILTTTEGSIWFEGEDITNLAAARIVAKGISHVPQGRHIFPTLSVLDNLMLGSYPRRKMKKEIVEDLERAFHLFPALKARPLQRGGTLSGGEQQMLAIGRALMGRPRLLTLDEPSSGLAPRFTEGIFSSFSRMNRDGLTLLVVEQDVAPLLAISHRGYILRNGRIMKQDRAAALAEREEKVSSDRQR